MTLRPLRNHGGGTLAAISGLHWSSRSNSFTAANSLPGIEVGSQHFDRFLVGIPLGPGRRCVNRHPMTIGGFSASTGAATYHCCDEIIATHRVATFTIMSSWKIQHRMDSLSFRPTGEILPISATSAAEFLLA